MQESNHWVLASNNAGKLREFGALLAPWGIQLSTQAELGVSEPDEPHVTFIENALAKARHASAHTGLPALADDSGLCVPALNGEPGVYSARYAAMAGYEKSDAANNRLLIERLQGVADRSAYYVCALAFVRFANDPCPVVIQTMWHGEMIDEPAGNNGFGYDPHFYLADLGATAAQLASEQKNRISHRGQAIEQLRTVLTTLNGRGV
jgi:XTP/dITP diphosphohydrolase